jgi:hypothetical protein
MSAEPAIFQQNPGQKKAAVAEGDTTAALLKMRQPGEGDEVAAASGQAGDGPYPDSTNVDDLHLVIRRWRFKGTKITIV